MENEGSSKKIIRSKFQRHVQVLIWKSYLQRKRRWRMLLFETVCGALLMLASIFAAKSVFLAPIEEVPEEPLSADEVLETLNKTTFVGYAPNTAPFNDIMADAAKALNINVTGAATEDGLEKLLMKTSSGTKIAQKPIVWVLFKPKDGNRWKVTIRSTARALFLKQNFGDTLVSHDSHLRTGFLAIQLAVSKAIVNKSSDKNTDIKLSLVTMPVSPLMDEKKVSRRLTMILLCFTIAFIIPALETEALVIRETQSHFKRALRLRRTGYVSMYFGWMSYAYMTAFPIIVLSGITIIYIFRWVHLFLAFIFIFAYISLTVVLALIMAMYHDNARDGCLWMMLLMVLQTLASELLVVHDYGKMSVTVAIVLRLFLPALGMVHGLHTFALYKTRENPSTVSTIFEENPISTIVSWFVMTFICFGILMLLQFSIGNGRAIDGQVSWTSIIFKKKQKTITALKPVEPLTGKEREHLQEVDELVAKAVSFRQVSKYSMVGDPVLSKVTMDIYRGEYSLIYAPHHEQQTAEIVESLITGLMHPDKGEIFILGHKSEPGLSLFNSRYALGYCHRCSVLLEDLTVQEHLVLFCKLSLWKESAKCRNEYCQLRSEILLAECDLQELANVKIKHLGSYYRAQLCWAIAVFMEPKIIVIPSPEDNVHYSAVLRDKIVRHRKYLTIIRTVHTTYSLEYGDRAFLFDNKALVFGGTPSYMFFKYGREYRIRMSLCIEDQRVEHKKREVLEKARQAGASVRAYLGSMVILRMPTTPTEAVSAFVHQMYNNSSEYGITSFIISLPDFEEVTNRALCEYQAISKQHMPTERDEFRMAALQRMAEPRSWTREITRTTTATQCRAVFSKCFAFYKHYYFVFIYTVMLALVVGFLIGITLSKLIKDMEKGYTSEQVEHGELLTIEAITAPTLLLLRADDNEVSKSIAKAYVFSEVKMKKSAIAHIEYTALLNPEELTDYLETRAMDSPAYYKFRYAYAMTVIKPNDKISVEAMYNPHHHDRSAAARSLGRVYISLLRHFTDQLDASILITDDPLSSTHYWVGGAVGPSAPLLIQSLLIMCMSHITLIPSNEHGLIRHMQIHAMNFSPARYWGMLYLFDILLLLLLYALIMTHAMVAVVATRWENSTDFMELAFVLPTILLLYGFSSIPQAYLFSLGPNPTLNAMLYVILNIAFGETTVVAKLLYGDMFNYVLQFMSLSPHFNFAYAFVKVKQVFIHNNECTFFIRKNLCPKRVFHKCCEKCGIMEDCFEKESYFFGDRGIIVEITAMLTTVAAFILLLILLEYKIIRRVYLFVITHWVYRVKPVADVKFSPGVIREREEVDEKVQQLMARNQNDKKVITFGECLLAKDAQVLESGHTIVCSTTLGVGRGESLAVVGGKGSGVHELLRLLAGRQLPSYGKVWAMGRWRLSVAPHMYSQHVALSCCDNTLPAWMIVKDALLLLATLRGVPRSSMNQEVQHYIDAFELRKASSKKVNQLLPEERARVHVAAALVGAPPVLLLDECVADQKFSARRAIYCALYHLRRRGHAVVTSSANLESLLPIATRLALLSRGRVMDIDPVEKLLDHYGYDGYIIVVHLRTEVNVRELFNGYFTNFHINDTTDVLTNVQVRDKSLNYKTVFQKMELMKVKNENLIYSYIVCEVPIHMICNNLLSKAHDKEFSNEMVFCPMLMKRCTPKKPIKPPKAKLNSLLTLEKKYDLIRLLELPWKAIFGR